MEAEGGPGAASGRHLRLVRPSGEPEAASPLVRYLAALDGSRVAWAAAGQGEPTLLALAGWVSHLSLDWAEGETGMFHRALAGRRRLLRFDAPGLGLSDRGRWDFSLDAQLELLDRVLVAAGAEQVALLGRSFSGPVALAYAATRPHRVSRLVLFGTSARISAAPGFPEGVDPDLVAAIGRLVRAEWGLASATIADLMLPGAESNRLSRYAEYERLAAGPEVAAGILDAQSRIDARELLSSVRAPALVVHRQGDRTVNVLAGRRLAESLPHARLVVLPGRANLPFHGDAGTLLREIDRFLDPAAAAVTGRERQVLHRLAEGLGNRAIAHELGISENTVARHVAHLLSKLGVRSRGAAVARSRALRLL